VLETETSVEVIVDLPGLTAEHVRVLFKNGVLVLAGEKPTPYPCEHVEPTFHLVERGFGRFARAVHLEGAFDGSGTRALLQGGELRVIVPKVVDRRGQEFLVPVTSA